MNTINFNQTGKLPIWLDDFQRMQDTLSEAITGIAKLFGQSGSTNCIVSGCSQTSSGTVVTVTTGFILIDGELIYVPGQTYNSSNISNPVLHVITDYDSNGDRNTLEGSAVRPWITKHAEVINFANLEVNESYVKFGTDIISLWMTPGLISSWDHINGSTFQYRKVNNQLQFKGGLKGAAFDSTIFTLPIGFRPSLIIKKLLFIDISGSPYLYWNLEIGTDGSFKLQSNYGGPDGKDIYINTLINL